jgi:hypothetical protein
MTHLIRHHRRMLFTFALLALAIHFACSSKPEQAGSKAAPTAELKAKMVYYAMPG